MTTREPRPGLATIRDVAQAAGVAVATVSAVVNGTKPVSDELRSRVRKAIDALDYHPSRIARALNMRQSHTLGFLAPDIANPGFIKIYKSVSAVARERGYTVLLISTGGNTTATQDAIRQVLELRVDGIFVIMTWDVVNGGVNLQQLAERNVRVVGVSGSYTQPDIDSFSWDEIGAGQQLARYLIRLGHRLVAFLGPQNSRGAELRWQGVREAFREAKVEGDGPYLIEAKGYDAASGYAATVQALADAIPFTAMIAFNDAMTTGALAAFNDQGIGVPQNVSLVTFGEYHLEFTRPRITSMVFNEEEIGRRAANRLIDRIEGIYDASPEQTNAPLTLSVQPSSRSPTSR